MSFLKRIRKKRNDYKFPLVIYDAAKCCFSLYLFLYITRPTKSPKNKRPRLCSAVYSGAPSSFLCDTKRP